MAKQSGLGDRLFIAGVNLSGDIGSIGNIGGGPAALDVTGIDKSGIERIGGLRDGRLEYSAWFNPATGQAHDVLSALPTGSQHVAYLRGTTRGNPAACLIAKQINYDPTRGNDGALSLAVNMQAADGTPVEWGRQLTSGGISTLTAATTGTVSMDDAAGTLFGLTAYLQVFAFTGTSAAIKIQHSSDDNVGDPWTDVVGAAFTSVTAGPTTERVSTATGASIERYLRLVVSGTFTNLQYAVVTVRHEVAH